ncbi:MAG TPA: ATP-binding protein [Thermoanaerobaculales bacterium]|nr:ATP-binding protein [Thermoanaerobaculales bacterium]
MKDDDLLELTLDKLRWLRLPGMAQDLPALLERARRENLSVLATVSALADAEKSSRIKSAINRRIRDARFPEVNTVDGFDFDFDPVRRKLRGRFLRCRPTGTADPFPLRSRWHREGVWEGRRTRPGGSA